MRKCRGKTREGGKQIIADRNHYSLNFWYWLGIMEMVLLGIAGSILAHSLYKLWKAAEQ